MKHKCPNGCFSDTEFTCDHMKGKQQEDDVVLILKDDEVPKEAGTVKEGMEHQQESLRRYCNARDDWDRRWREREAIERHEKRHSKGLLPNVDYYEGMAPRIMRHGLGYDQKLKRVEGWQ